MPEFLPSSVEQLTEPASIALIEHIRREPIQTGLLAQPIPTAYVRQGAGGVPILLLHGFDSSVFEFRRLMPLLAERGEVWAVDLLGFGFTERAEGLSLGPRAIGEHLYRFWQQMIGKPAILVGASMGGAAAIDLTLDHPEAVAKLVLVDSVGFTRGPAVGRFLFPPLDRWATRVLKSARVRSRVSLNAYRDARLASTDAACCAALHLEMPGWERAMMAFTKSGGYGFLGDRLGQIDKETLILWGESDRILGTRSAEQFQRAIAGSKLIWVRDCGHVPHLEQPGFTAAQILAF